MYCTTIYWQLDRIKQLDIYDAKSSFTRYLIKQLDGIKQLNMYVRHWIVFHRSLN